MNKDFQEEFELHLGNIAGGYCAMTDADMLWEEKQEHIEAARKSYQVCKKHFKDDADNLHRWHVGMPCVFKCPISDCEIEVIVPVSTIQLYNFLSFCKKQNSGEYDDEYFIQLECLMAYDEDEE